MSKKVFDSYKARQALFASVLISLILTILILLWVFAWPIAAGLSILFGVLTVIYLFLCFREWVEYGEWDWDIF